MSLLIALTSVRISRTSVLMVCRRLKSDMLSRISVRFAHLESSSAAVLKEVEMGLNLALIALSPQLP